MRRLLAAVAFLTRVPIPARYEFDARDVGRATLVFPVVGACLGALQLALLYVLLLARGTHPQTLSPLLALLLAAVVIAFAARLTGALHLDAVADMADGFGGGGTAEDVLRIMRDHVIGAYGAVALILVLLAKTIALALLIERDRYVAPLLLAPALARWATVPLGCFMPYARRTGGGLGAAVTDYVGQAELVGATSLAASLTFALVNHGFVDARVALTTWAIVVALTMWNARLCRRRIGGVTGDTLGANTEACETAVLVVSAIIYG